MITIWGVDHCVCGGEVAGQGLCVCVAVLQSLSI